MVSQGKLLQHTFMLRNLGTTELRLLEASATCGCTEFRFEPKNLAPGQDGKVFVSMDTSGREGSLIAKVHSVFEDPTGAQCFQSFFVGCIVDRTELLYPLPTRVALLRQLNVPGSSAPFSIECKQLTQRKLPTRLVMIGEQVPYLEVLLDRDGAFEPMESSDTQRARATGVVRLTRVPDAGVQPNSLRLRVEFPDGQPREVQLAVELVDAVQWHVEPPALYLGSIPAGSTVTRRVRVRSPLLPGGMPTVRCSASTLDAAWEAPVEGDAASAEVRTLRVQYTSPETAGPFEAWIEIEPEGAAQRIEVGGIAR